MNTNSIVSAFQQLKWSVNRKIGVCFAFLVLLIFVSSILVFASILNLENTSSAEQQKSLELADATAFNQQLEVLLISYSDAIYLTHQKQVNATYTVQSHATLNHLRLDDPNQLKMPGSLLFKLNKNDAQLSDVLDQLDTLISKENFQAADKLWTDNQELRNNTATVTAQLQRQIENDSALLNSQSNFSSTFTKITAVVVGVLSVLFAVLFARLISAAIGQPLATTRRYLESMSAGDLSHELNLKNNDELGDMARALNLSVRTLRGIIESFDIGSKVASAANSLHLISSVQSKHATQQVSHISQISSAMTELSAVALNINNNATEVTLAAQTALEQAQYMSATSGEVNRIFHQLKETVDEAGKGIEKAEEDFSYIIERLNAVNEQSESTETIVSIITGIASEIHILSLNAAIEAVGAGQYGERFSIIAREVKELAGRSSTAAEQVRALIADTRSSLVATRQEAEQRQQSIGEVVNLGMRVEAVVTEAVQKVESNQIAAEAILEAAANSSDQSAQIKSAAYEQQVASEQILTTISAIMEVVKAGAEGSNQVAHTSAELNDLSRLLANNLSELKLPLTIANPNHA